MRGGKVGGMIGNAEGAVIATPQNGPDPWRTVLSVRATGYEESEHANTGNVPWWMSARNLHGIPR